MRKRCLAKIRASSPAAGNSPTSPSTNHASAANISPTMASTTGGTALNGEAL